VSVKDESICFNGSRYRNGRPSYVDKETGGSEITLPGREPNGFRFIRVKCKAIKAEPVM